MPAGTANTAVPAAGPSADPDSAPSDPAAAEPATARVLPHLPGDSPSSGTGAADRYKHRSSASVLRATPDNYYDHDEIAGLFGIGSPHGECSPPVAYAEHRHSLRERFSAYHRVYDGWDTKWGELSDGSIILSGWDMPDGGADWELNRSGDIVTAKGHAIDSLLDDGATEADRTGSHIEQRLRATGGSIAETGPARASVDRITDGGIVPHARPAPGTGIYLLWEWTEFRYGQPPTTKEPAAWAAWTLLDSYSSSCLSERLTAVCSADSLPESPHLRNDSSGSGLGAVIWSIFCGLGPRP